MEKKKYLESNINKRNDNFCQYSMNFQEEKIEEPKPNAEEEQDLQVNYGYKLIEKIS